MADSTLTAAQRRKQKILQRGEERMAKVLGTYGQGAGVPIPAVQRCQFYPTVQSHKHNNLTSSKYEPHAESISCVPSREADAAVPGQQSTSPATGAAPAAQQDQPSPSLTQPYRRSGANEAAQRSLASMPEPPAASSIPASTPATKVAPDAATVPFASAMQAASFQMLPLRFVCAVGIAAAATSYDWFMPGISLAVQVMVANIILIFSAAWMLKNDPERCQSIMQQVHIRQGTFLDGVFGIVARATRVPSWTMRVGFTVAWALYVDSGTYIAAAIVCYLLNRTQVPPPLEQNVIVE